VGWSVQETATEFRLLPPGVFNHENTIDAVLGEEVEPEEQAESSPHFRNLYFCIDFCG
jgi:hypothetical protein